MMDFWFECREKYVDPGTELTVLRADDWGLSYHLLVWTRFMVEQEGRSIL